MQSMEMKTDEGKTHFKEAINRIMAMSLVHQKLYTEKELSQIDLKSYIEELVNEIITYSNNKKEIKIEIETNVKGIDLISVVPLGLLINELVSNSLKHAFIENKENIIKIKIVDLEKEYQFDYSDNGSWKENENSSSNFGIELIGILTEQLNGTKTLDTSNGTHYQFLLSKFLFIG
jgi:two-component sensor histidine kinase